MERNFDRRVEVLVPVLDDKLRRTLKERLLDAQLWDSVRATELYSDGVYRTPHSTISRGMLAISRISPSIITH
jgi:polyphosphate kinase